MKFIITKINSIYLASIICIGLSLLTIKVADINKRLVSITQYSTNILKENINNDKKELIAIDRSLKVHKDTLGFLQKLMIAIYLTCLFFVVFLLLNENVNYLFKSAIIVPIIYLLFIHRILFTPLY